MGEQAQIAREGLRPSEIGAFVKKWRMAFFFIAACGVILLGVSVVQFLSIRATLRDAEAGVIRAQMSVARRHYEREEYEESAYWYQRAVDQGYVVANHPLGNLHSDGKVADADNAYALALMIEAAEAHYTDAQLTLSRYYYEGDVVDQDYEKAYWWADVARHNNLSPGYPRRFLGRDGIAFRLDDPGELTKEEIDAIRRDSLRWREQFRDYYDLELTEDEEEEDG